MRQKFSSMSFCLFYTEYLFLLKKTDDFLLMIVLLFFQVALNKLIFILMFIKMQL